MNNSWDLLLKKLGIAKTFYDAMQKQYTVEDEALLKMVNYLGYPLKKIEDSAELLQKIEDKRWQSVLEPIYIVRSNNKTFDVVLKKSDSKMFDLNIATQEGKEIVVQHQTQLTEEKKIGRSIYVKLQVTITSDMEPQYYDLRVNLQGKKYGSVLAITPDKCYLPDVLQQRKLWGYAVQLYSLVSRRNWGIGDFTDLKNFVKICARQGADVIGVNPMNVLQHDFPENASPYSSISRLFLNPIYIDVEEVSGFEEQMLESREEELKQARNSENIDYSTVYNLKIDCLREIFAKWQKNKDGEEYKKFTEFCAEQGSDLDNLAVYQVIYSVYHDKAYRGWRDWPQELQNPNGLAVVKFKNKHKNEVMFFKFLQYIAFEQLKNVYKQIKESGLQIGLYRDLPVGVNKDSEELWSGNDLFIKECGAGAPPDVFFPTGQKWCLGAFNPTSLKNNAYKPYIKILRAAMQGAGALRIDHVMGLMRLYIIPDCGDDGTYIYYNFDEMLGIVALESYLNKCMVVGESIGNVPDGFLAKIEERGIYSLSVLWAERWNGLGDFKQPCDFPQKAFCSVGTHDMAPLKMRWFGYDIETMYNLKMLSDEDRVNQYKGREDERCRLLRALDNSGSWPQDKPRQGDCLYGEGYPNGITEAVEKFVSQSASEVYLAQLEDIFGVEVLQNLPGTDRDKHPNWRRKLPVCLEDLENTEEMRRARAEIKR
ncbi:MAG: 4-alpha-glucanotransferase [Alphaproteobacteria bacterium]|nr:4-alpha-glucanotransferase [Alphaproteobacteria bacterium]